MDGTLIDSQLDITCTINHVRAVNHGLPPLQSAQVVEWINWHDRNLALLFYGTETYEARDRELFESHYFEQCTVNVTLFPQVRETVEALSSRGVRLSVATNASTVFARRMLAHLGIDHHFDHIIGPDVGGASKPDPAMLHHILTAYAFDAISHDAWMVGDNSKDVEAAHRAGITSVFATWGFSEEGEAHLVLDSPDALVDIVQS